MKVGGCVACVCLALSPVSMVHAETKFTGGIGLELGGDELLKVVYSSGDAEPLKAGDGLVLKGGALVSLNQDKTVELALTAGWKYKAITASNGDISLSRFPLEATLYRSFDKHRVGAGAVYHAGIELSGSGAASWINAYKHDLESKVGYALSYDYFFSPKWGVGARYTALDYSVKGGDTVDAGSLGLYLTGNF